MQLEARFALKLSLASAPVHVGAHEWLSLGYLHHDTWSKCAVMAVKFLVLGKQ